MHSLKPSKLEDFLVVFSNCRPILVGGHAAHLWGMHLLTDEELKPFFPLTSKDLDILGTEAMALELRDQLNCELFLNKRDPKEFIVAALKINNYPIEILSRIDGIPTHAILASAQTIKYQGIPISIIHPILLFQSKVRNVICLSDPKAPRNDAKHACILSKCIPIFLSKLELRALVDNVQALASFRSSYYGTNGGKMLDINWQALIPKTIIEQCHSAEDNPEYRQIRKVLQAFDPNIFNQALH